ncbi:hypothetical protein [Prevotella intermedia]|nr:hypothetical protein [Prevotella intermedia]
MEKQDKAFTIASDIVKLLITLSTGVITFTVTFCRTFLGSVSGVHSIGWLLASWIILVISMIFGFLTLGAMVGNLSKTNKSDIKQSEGEDSEDEKNSGVYSSNITILEIAQILTFVVGVAFVFIFEYQNLSIKDTPTKENLTEFRMIEKSSYSLLDSLKVDTIIISNK